MSHGNVSRLVNGLSLERDRVCGQATQVKGFLSSDISQDFREDALEDHHTAGVEGEQGQARVSGFSVVRFELLHAPVTGIREDLLRTDGGDWISSQQSLQRVAGSAIIIMTMALKAASNCDAHR